MLNFLRNVKFLTSWRGIEGGGRKVESDFRVYGTSNAQRVKL